MGWRNRITLKVSRNCTVMSLQIAGKLKKHISGKESANAGG